MIVPFFALTSLITLIPAFVILERFHVAGASSAILGLALTATAFVMPAAHVDRFTRLLQPVVIAILAAPALWMVAQLLPTPASLENQVWSSASSALSRPIAGAITIDIGATLLSLAQYCAIAAAAIVTAAVALDRQRAVSIFHILMAIATLIAARQTLIETGLLGNADAGDPADGEEAMFIAVAGAVLSCAAALHAYDRLSRSGRLHQTEPAKFFPLATASIAFLICGAAVLIRGEAGLIFSVLLGTGVLGSLFVIRHWMLGSWGKAGLAAAGAVAVFSAVATIPIKQNVDLALAWSAQNQTAAERMLADVPLFGSGAGGYSALRPIYSDVEAGSPPPPAAAAVVIVEMGRAFFGGLIIASLCGAWLLFGRALARRQDYIFAGAGAAMLAAAPVLVFVSGGMFGLGASLLAGVLIGLAFAQSQSSSPSWDISFALQTASAKSVNGEGGASGGKTRPRVALALVGLVLFAQAAWILGAEYYTRGQPNLASDPGYLGAAARERIQEAAAFAVVRGDLWAESAKAKIAAAPDSDVRLSPNSAPAAALADLIRAVRYAPHRSDVWLTLAKLADRYKLAGFDAGALLKMSYYTAPNDLALLQSRLNVAMTAESSAEDTELRDMIQRDISLILTRQPQLRPALIAAYRSASPARKLIAERMISEVDPGYLRTILRNNSGTVPHATP